MGVPLDRQKQIRDADILLSMGMRPGIVRIQTGLTASKIRTRSVKLREQLQSMVVHRGRWKSAKNLVSKTDPHMESVSFLLIYLRYAEAPQEGVDLEAFVKSFTHYCCALEVDPTCPADYSLDINRCWILARDYREGLIAIVDCSRCENGKLIRFQSTVNCKCPVCGKDGQPEELKKKKKQERQSKGKQTQVA